MSTTADAIAPPGRPDVAPPRQKLLERGSKAAGKLISVLVISAISTLGPTDPSALRRARIGDWIIECRLVLQLLIGASFVGLSAFFLISFIESSSTSFLQKIAISLVVSISLFLIDLTIVSKLQQYRAETESKHFGFQSPRTLWRKLKAPLLILFRIPLALVNAYVFATIMMVALFSQEINSRMADAQRNLDAEILHEAERQVLQERSEISGRLDRVESDRTRELSAFDRQIRQLSDEIDAPEPATSATAVRDTIAQEVSRLTSDKDDAERRSAFLTRWISCEERGLRARDDQYCEGIPELTGVPGCGRACRLRVSEKATVDQRLRSLNEQLTAAQNRLTRHQQDREQQIREEAEARRRTERSARTDIERLRNERREAERRFREAEATLLARARALDNIETVRQEARTLAARDRRFENPVRGILPRIDTLFAIENEDWWRWVWFQCIKFIFVFIELNAILVTVFASVRRSAEIIDYVDFVEASRKHVFVASEADAQRVPFGPGPLDQAR